MTPSFPKRSATWSTLLLVGISAALVGGGAAFLALTFWWTLNGQEPHYLDSGVFYLAPALVSLLIGPLFWWLMILRPRRLTLRRGILVGILSSLVAHPLTWFLALVILSLSRRNTNLGSAYPINIGLEIHNPIELLQGSLVLSVLSLFYVGWITLIVGGVAGGVLARVVAHLRRNR